MPDYLNRNADRGAGTETLACSTQIEVPLESKVGLFIEQSEMKPVHPATSSWKPGAPTDRGGESKNAIETHAVPFEPRRVDLVLGP